MAAREWGFLTNHARALLCVGVDDVVRLRDLAETLGVTERTAFAIMADLTEAGYVAKHREGRRNRYVINDHLPLPDTDGSSRQLTVGEVLGLLLQMNDDCDS